MSLNIKNERAHRLVQELADLTGESQTAAVAGAVEEKLARLRPRQQHDLAPKLLEIGREMAGRMSDADKAADHGQLLYDENGLPA